MTPKPHHDHSATVRTAQNQRHNVREAQAQTPEVRTAPTSLLDKTSKPLPATRSDVLDHLAGILDNLERTVYALRWSHHFTLPEHASPTRAEANDKGARESHRLIVDSIMELARIAVPGDPYVLATLAQRQSAIRAARM